MRVAVIGAGNGGQAMATYVSMCGHSVALYDRSESRVLNLRSLDSFSLEGKVLGHAHIETITHNLAEAIRGAELVMITTTANAHGDLGRQIAPICENGQIFVLNPGRTCGALVFLQALRVYGCSKRVFVSEAQTLVYACRLIQDGSINVIGVKDEVLMSALPASDTKYVLDCVNQIYPCFKPAENVLRTSLENIGAIFHPCVLLLNAGTIERGTEFFFYRDMTERIAAFIEAVDEERLSLGKAFGVDLLGVSDWIKFAYKDTKGTTLCERMRNNPGYHDIKSPTSVFVRQLTEDIPTGIIPMLELGKAVGLEMKLFESIAFLASSLLGVNFFASGRTLDRLGLNGLSHEIILERITR